MEGYFIGKHGTMPSRTGETNYRFHKAKKHPPVHRGCVCAIIPVLGLEGVQRGSPKSPQDAVLDSNPERYTGKEGYDNNCPASTAAYIAQRRGYNVVAMSSATNPFLRGLMKSPWSIWKDSSGNRVTPININAANPIVLFNHLQSNIKEGSEYIFGYANKSILEGQTNFHLVVLSQDKNGIHLYDPTERRRYDGDSKVRDQLKNILYDKPQYILRVDNLDFNENAMKRLVKEA